MACVGGLWHNAFEQPREHSGPAIVGIALTLAWTFAAIDSAANDEAHGRMRTLAVRAAAGAQGHRGYLEYLVRVLARRWAPHAVVPGAASQVVHAFGASVCDVAGRRASIREILAEWRASGALMPEIARLSHGFAARVLEGWAWLHSVVVAGRIARKRLLVHSEPSRRPLRRLVDLVPIDARMPAQAP